MAHQTPIDRVIPDELMIALGQALEADQFGMVLVVNQYALDQLARDKPALLELEGGGVILLVTERAVNDVYQGEDGEGANDGV